MEENPIRWFEIYVRDIQRAKKFYETVLDINLELLKNPGPGVDEMWQFPMQQGLPGATGALVKMKGVESGNNSVIIYFGCADCAIEAKRAPEAGGKIFKDKFAIGPHGFIALVTDTEGNVIGLHSMK